MTWRYKYRKVVAEVALLVFWALGHGRKRGTGLYPKTWFDRES